MKSSTLAVILSVLSLGGVVALYVKVDDLSGQIRRSRAGRDADDRTVAVSEGPEYVIRGADGAAGSHRAPPRSVGDTLAADRAGLGPAPASATLEERLARLEEREEERSRNGGDLATGRIYRMPKFVRDVDELATHLKLSATQKDRVQDAIRRGKARIDEILSIPGTDGKTIKEVRAERNLKLQAALTNPEKNAGQMVALAFSGQRLDERIPGRNETYRQEIDRIRGETRNEIKGSLDVDQSKAFDDTEVNHLLGATGEGVSITTAISVGSNMARTAIAEPIPVEDGASPAPTGPGKKE